VEVNNNISHDSKDKRSLSPMSSPVSRPESPSDFQGRESVATSGEILRIGGPDNYSSRVASDIKVRGPVGHFTRGPNLRAASLDAPRVGFEVRTIPRCDFERVLWSQTRPDFDGSGQDLACL
jgi:hypothetical protein